jgi:hypothetical protein
LEGVCNKALSDGMENPTRKKKKHQPFDSQPVTPQKKAHTKKAVAFKKFYCLKQKKKKL